VSLKSWVCSHMALLRRLLSWPVLWRISVCLILKHCQHTPDALCPVCAAKLRALKYAHTPALGLDRRVYCRKCGLQLSMRNAVPKCSNKRTSSTTVAVDSKPQIVLVNW
jgi:predicted amidophosphoribosyltransferase